MNDIELEDVGMSLLFGDCFDRILEVPAQSVDLVLADLPYGMTANKWDSVIDLDRMWDKLRAVTKPTSALVMNAAQPFTTQLMLSGQKYWKHNWQWNKNNSAGFATAKHRPLPVVEDICVFGFGGRVNYYPQMEVRGKVRKKGGYSTSTNYGIEPSISHNNTYYPKSLINISNANQAGKIHPTQKPLELITYLIETYSRPGDLVLDFCFGSCTAGVAALNTGRRFIGIERDPDYFERGSNRVIQRYIETLVE